MFGIKSLKDEVKNLNKKLESYEHDTRDKNELQRIVSELSRDNADFKSEISKLKIEIRVQTEADIYFSCAKISKKLLDGEPKEKVFEEVDYRNSLMAQLAQQGQQQNLSNYSLGSGGAFLQAPGLGNFYPRF